MASNCNTKQYYSSNAKQYIDITNGVDMSAHYGKFLPYLTKGAKVLDVGFGSGRDMQYFANMGYDVTGVDNVAEFVVNAQNLGMHVELCDYHNLPYVKQFDAIWACASLLHSNNLPLAFQNITKALKAGGCAFVSMKYGNGSEIKNGRFYQYVDEQLLVDLCHQCGLSIVEIYQTQDILGRENLWLNAILTKN